MLLRISAVSPEGLCQLCLQVLDLQDRTTNGGHVHGRDPKGPGTERAEGAGVLVINPRA